MHSAARAQLHGVARQRPGGMVRVFDTEHDLLDRLSDEDATLARTMGVAPSLLVDAGRWTPPGPDACRQVFGLVVLDGLMVRTANVNGVLCPELLGQGDLLRPWEEDAEHSVHPELLSTWRVIVPTTMAVLDGRFVEVLRRWPWISEALLARSVRRSRSLVLRMAIPQMRRADDRLRTLMRDLADRWGRVTPHGVTVPLPLTNQLIAQLVCLRRPTVSSTMTRLARTGEIVRSADGGFVLNLPDSVREPAEPVDLASASA